MKNSTVLIVLTVIILFIFSVIPASVVSKPIDKDPPVKKMDPPDGMVTNISATISPPILDGIISVSENWYSHDHIGNACVAIDPNPVAKVYMTVEIDSNGTYKYLWIGIDMISPNYLESGDGQWLRIDWDQDGVLDYEDHTGWNESDGDDSTSGAEWMIPWGTVRVNPSKTPYQMNFSLINNSFDILIHIEIYGYNGTSEYDDDEDEEEKPEEDDEGEDNGNETNGNNKKDKVNKTKGYEKDKKNKKRSIDKDDSCEANKTNNKTSESATFPPRPNAGPFISITICAWKIPDVCEFDDDDDDEYDADDDRDDDDEEDDDDEDENDDDKCKNDKDKEDKSNKNGNSKGKTNNSNKSDEEKNKIDSDKPPKKKSTEMEFGIFAGDYLYFEYNLSLELLENIKMYNTSVFEGMHILNASFNKQHESNNLFKGDGSGAKLLGHDNPVALVQILARNNITIILNITEGWTTAQDNGNVTLKKDNMSVLLRLLGRPISSYTKVTNNQVIVVMVKGSQLQLRVANVSALKNKSEYPGCIWFEETQNVIFDNIGYEILGADATITGSVEAPNTQINTYLDGFDVDINKIESNSVSFVLTSKSESGKMVAVSILKKTLLLPENTEVFMILNNKVLPEVKELAELTADESGFHRVSDEDGEQILLSVSEVSTQEITIRFIPEVDTTPLAEPWTLWDFAIVFAILIVIIIAGMYMYVSRRED